MQLDQQIIKLCQKISKNLVTVREMNEWYRDRGIEHFFLSVNAVRTVNRLPMLIDALETAAEGLQPHDAQLIKSMLIDFRDWCTETLDNERTGNDRLNHAVIVPEIDRWVSEWTDVSNRLTGQKIHSLNAGTSKTQLEDSPDVVKEKVERSPGGAAWAHAALDILRENPELPNCKIASDPRVNRDPGTLSRNEIFREGAKEIRESSKAAQRERHLSRNPDQNSRIDRRSE